MILWTTFNHQSKIRVKIRSINLFIEKMDFNQEAFFINQLTRIRIKVVGKNP